MAEPKIYVADLAAYTNGHLHGVWIDAVEDIDDIWEQIKTMLSQSPVEDAEEYAIHDYEGFGSYALSEHEGIEQVHEIARFIEEHGDIAAELLNYYSDIDEAKKAIEDNYQGCYTSLADYAQSFTEENSEVPKHLELYIDYQRMGRDWELSGNILTLETAHNEIHIFWSF